MSFKGVFPALITPMLGDQTVDYRSLGDLIEFQMDKGVHGLFPLGTTGEGLLFTPEERKQIAEFIVKTVNGRIPVVVHVGHLRTDVTIELAKHAEEIGATGISVICPYFFPLTDEMIYHHFKAVSQAVSKDFPVFVYHFPGNTRNSVTLDVLLKLTETCRNIRALKFTDTNFEEVQKISFAVPNDFSIMLGPDQLFFAGLSVGTQGSVSGNANIFPEPYVRLYECFQKGAFEEAKKEQETILQIAEALQYGSNISILKNALAYRGLNGGFVRSPLKDITKMEKEQLFEQLKHIRV